MRQKKKVMKLVEDFETYESALRRVTEEFAANTHLCGVDCTNLNPHAVRDKDGYRCVGCPLGYGDGCLPSKIKDMLYLAIAKCKENNL